MNQVISFSFKSYVFVSYSRWMKSSFAYCSFVHLSKKRCFKKNKFFLSFKYIIIWMTKEKSILTMQLSKHEWMYWKRISTSMLGCLLLKGIILVCFPLAFRSISCRVAWNRACLPRSYICWGLNGPQIGMIIRKTLRVLKHDK